MRACVPVKVLGLVLASSVAAAAPLVAEPLADEAATAAALRRYYTKYVYRIPMRDGVKLYTVAFVPKDDHRTWPILMTRTPYSCKPYGVDSYPTTNLRGLVPAAELVRAGYTFVQQDVRGRWMSEGSFVDVRPHRTEE